jgi:hypothetical protein
MRKSAQLAGGNNHDFVEREIVAQRRESAGDNNS